MTEESRRELDRWNFDASEKAVIELIADKTALEEKVKTLEAINAQLIARIPERIPMPVFDNSITLPKSGS